MNFFKSLFKSKPKIKIKIKIKNDIEPVIKAPKVKSAKIDLYSLTLDNISLGQPIPVEHPLNEFFKENVDLIDESNGITITVTGGRLCAIGLSIEVFSGSLSNKKEAVLVEDINTPDKVISLFGHPYWKYVDQVDGKIILFYEPDQGEFEVQFEFVKAELLSVIYLINHGVLSKQEQRKSHGVNKTWPPTIFDKGTWSR